MALPSSPRHVPPLRVCRSAAPASTLIADIVAARRIDPRAKELGYNDYEKQRTDYLAQRRARCTGHRGLAVAEAPTTH